MSFTFKFKTSVLKNFWHHFMYQWIKRCNLLFFVLFLLLAVVGGYRWRADLITYHWTDEEKKAYLERTSKETTFNRVRFDAALETLTTLEEQHRENPTIQRDLFFGRQKKERQ